MSRFRWPVQFALLNNDCLWVMDEIQLMGAGLSTTTQLEAFRNTLGTVYPVHSVWMSATLEKDWLNTIDFAPISPDMDEIGLSEDDLTDTSVRKRFEAKKALSKADCPGHDFKKIAEIILKEHQKGSRTLFVANTVKRATEIYSAIKQKKPKASLVLVHSRFRPPDRKKALDKALSKPGEEGSICIATQVVEAGVDFSASTLITDLAPWASLVQRFGRCNRYGETETAKVLWLDIDLKKKGSALPYSAEELTKSALILSADLKDAGSNSLPSVTTKTDNLHVLRRKDLIDLFDTTPDLSGLDIDISRYIRETDDHDLHVFWRDIPKDERPQGEEPSPDRDELCSVPLRDMKDHQSWRWDHLEKVWVRPESLVPGMILMVRACDGGYDPEIGWTGNAKDVPEPIRSEKLPEEANDDDYKASLTWQSLNDHTEMVVNELGQILAELENFDDGWTKILELAARWHDAGKAHQVFQSAMVGDPPEADTDIVWGKTGRGSVHYERKGFRHELASALAMLENGLPDLAAYLAAAHHGKVRLSIRSLPHEKSPDDPSKRFARGIWTEMFSRRWIWAVGRDWPIPLLTFR